ncbi:MAG: hypothetical protein GX639_09070 [Fibrobacter sp.]|nr:hypothetical protein [Fibrobacter sp.]
MAVKYFQIIESSPDGIVLEPVDSDRQFVFKEVKRQYKFQQPGDTNVHTERDVEPASNRWIYLFGKYKNGKCKVYEIQTNEEGKFDTYQLPENESAYSRPSPAYKDVVCVDNLDGKNNLITYYVMLSEMKLPHNRFFDPQNGLIKDPSKRAANVDDPEQTQVAVFDDYEVCSVTNHLKLARLLNQGYQNALNEFYKFRYDLSLEGEYPEDLRVDTQTDSNAPQFVDNQEMQEERLKRFAASIVLALITKEQKKVGTYPNGQPKYLAEYNDKIMFLDRNGNFFNDYIRGKVEPELRAQIKIRDKVSLLNELMVDTHFNETLNDYLLNDELDDSEARAQYITEQFDEITARLDETEDGREIIGLYYEKNYRFFGKNDKTIPNLVEKATKDFKSTARAQKIVKSCISIFSALVKFTMEHQKLKFAEKEKQIAELFDTYVFLKIVRMVVDRKKLSHLLPDIEYFEYKIDPPSKIVYNRLGDVKDLFAKFSAVLNALNFLKNFIEYKEKGARSAYLAAKDANLILLWAAELALTPNKETHELSKIGKFLDSHGVTATVVKKVNYATIAITGTIDTALHGYDAYNAIVNEGDVDAGIFKSIEGLGSTCLAASGICYLTGAGVGWGAGLMLVGTLLNATGGAGYVLTDDTPLSVFLKNCPWGIHKNYNQDYATLKKSVERILAVIYNFKLKAAFNPENINELYIDIQPKIVSPNMKIELYLSTASGDPITIDSNNYEVIHNPASDPIIRFTRKGFVGLGFLNVKAKIDTYGDGTFILPSPDKYNETKVTGYK